MQLKAGLVVADKYVLDREIGRGGMSSVWAAEHRALGAPVAIKLLHADATEPLCQRFNREAQATARLRCPNVVRVSDVGLDSGRLYLVMELLDGEDLKTHLRRVGHRLDPRRACNIVRQIARVLRQAHSAGVVHRDLKPENVFLCRDDDMEIVKILDFGIAKCLFEYPITAPGFVLGTPGYMSPEQALGLPMIDHRADLWSLAVIAYRMLTAAMPFPARRSVDILRAMVTHDFVRPSQHAPELGSAADAIFSRAFLPSIEGRFENAEEMAELLADALAHSSNRILINTDSKIAAAAVAPSPGGAVPAPLSREGAPVEPPGPASADAEPTIREGAGSQLAIASRAPGPAPSSGETAALLPAQAPAQAADPAPPAPAPNGDSPIERAGRPWRNRLIGLGSMRVDAASATEAAPTVSAGEDDEAPTLAYQGRQSGVAPETPTASPFWLVTRARRARTGRWSTVALVVLAVLVTAANLLLAETRRQELADPGTCAPESAREARYP